MKRLYRKAKRALLVAVAVISLLPQGLNGQIDGEFFRGGINDGVKIIEAYMAPWARAFGAGLNSGWYNTAKPHSFGGFDITLTVSAGLVPESHQSYDLAELDFQNISLENPMAPTIAPTISGSTNMGPAMESIDPNSGLQLANFYAPAGTGLNFVPVPMIQGGLGLPLGTEIKGRFIPKIAMDDSYISMWGFGLKHSIAQYIPGYEFLPYDISLFGAYSKIEGKVPFDAKPGSYDNYTVYTADSFSDQHMLGVIDGWNASVIGSLNLPVVTLYGALGYAGSSTVLDIVGNIPIPSVSGSTVVYVDDEVVTDIDKVEIQDFSGLRANVGVRLKFAIFTIHADYTRSQYNVISGGFGISFR